MKRTLLLASPHMRGRDVKDAQYLLHKRGYSVRVDGEFGPHTAAVSRKCKLDLGFPLRDCRPTFGPVLYNLLTGKAKVPASFKLRAKARRIAAAKRAKSTPARVEAYLNLALSQEGVKEHPYGSNRVKYGYWYGLIGPWCAAFCSWTAAHIYRPFRFRYAYCPFVVDDARRHRNGLSIAGGPSHDLTAIIFALFDWPWESRGTADHIGVTVPEWFLRAHHPNQLRRAKRQFGSLGHGDFWCIEGNTSLGNQSNGGAVMLRKRNRRDVQAFVRARV